jgi:Ca-activated chloride channel homolog
MKRAYSKIVDYATVRLFTKGHAGAQSVRVRFLFSLLIFCISGVEMLSQNTRQQVRSGNELYGQEKFTEAEVAYRKSLMGKNPVKEAQFNLGNALLKQKKYDEAVQQFQVLAGTTEDKKELGALYHNMGNAYLEACICTNNVEESTGSTAR